MTLTKDQIEAAARKGIEAWAAPGLAYSRFVAGALWMQAEMEKLIEQRERAAWEAARQSGARTHQEMCLDYVKFEHWKARNES